MAEAEITQMNSRLLIEWFEEVGPHHDFREVQRHQVKKTVVLRAFRFVEMNLAYLRMLLVTFKLESKRWKDIIKKDCLPSCFAATILKKPLEPLWSTRIAKMFRVQKLLHVCTIQTRMDFVETFGLLLENICFRHLGACILMII